MPPRNWPHGLAGQRPKAVTEMRRPTCHRLRNCHGLNRSSRHPKKHLLTQLLRKNRLRNQYLNQNRNRNLRLFLSPSSKKVQSRSQSRNRNPNQSRKLNRSRLSRLPPHLRTFPLKCVNPFCLSPRRLQKTKVRPVGRHLNPCRLHLLKAPDLRPANSKIHLRRRRRCRHHHLLQPVQLQQQWKSQLHPTRRRRLLKAWHNQRQKHQ